MRRFALPGAPPAATGAWLRIEDALVDGRGTLVVRLFGLLPIARRRGKVLDYSVRG